jgi:hypothetical protein
MPDIKISAATDITSVTGTDKVPVARAASTTSYYATITELGTYAATVAPVQSVAGRTGTVTLAHTDLTDWAATLAAYAPLAGPTFTGVPAAPTAAPGTNTTQLATTAFTTAAVAAATTGVSSVNTRTGAITIIGADLTAAGGALLAGPTFTGVPAAPTAAVDTNTTQLATTAMVLAQAAAATPLPDGVAAVGSSTRYARADHVHASPPDVGRNLIHNGMWRVQQRGAAGWSTNNTYTVDRWQMAFTGGTMATSVGAFSDGNRVSIGDEAAITYLACAAAGTSGAGDYAFLCQYIEGVSRLSNKTVTVSFWAYATSGTPKLGVGIRQNFGTGGSPSASVDMTGQSVTLSTTPVRYSLSFNVPSTSGKTFGTTVNTDYSRLAFAFSSGSTNAAILGTPGVQTNTFVLWGVQLEVGSVATPLEKPDLRAELANCQRFYQIGQLVTAGYTAGVQTIYLSSLLPVLMRASPSVTPSTVTLSGCGSLAGGAYGGETVWLSAATVGGAFTCSASFTASADL